MLELSGYKAVEQRFCGVCRWYLAADEEYHTVQGFGFCRRNSPQISGWPKVHASDECGEFKHFSEQIAANGDPTGDP